MYDAVELSKYIVTRCEQKSNPISNLQLQKILYYIQKKFLENDDLAFGDAIEAWRFGPVVPNVYYFFCGYGAMPIERVFDVKIEEKDEDVVNTIIDVKCRLNPWEMVEETHREGGAWAKVYESGRGNRKPIPVELIKEAG